MVVFQHQRSGWAQQGQGLILRIFPDAADKIWAVQ